MTCFTEKVLFYLIFFVTADLTSAVVSLTSGVFFFSKMLDSERLINGQYTYQMDSYVSWSVVWLLMDSRTNKMSITRLCENLLSSCLL